MSQGTPDISVIFPVYNEKENLKELCARVVDTLEAMGKTFELVAIDDGSSDGSFALLKELRSEDKRLRVIRMTRNFGQSAALYAGFAQARGNIVVMLDADLQNYPEDIPLLIKKLEEGYDMVSGWRADRKDSFFRSIVSGFLNKFIAWVTKVPLHDYGCALKAFRRELVDNMGLLEHRCRYLPADVSSLGGEVTEVKVRHDERAHGESKYGLFKLIRTAIDLITSITSVPLQIIGVVGWIFAFAGFAMAIRVWLYRIMYGNINALESVVAAFFFLAGVQMVATGIMCEYVSRIYIEVQRKPYYVIKEEAE